MQRPSYALALLLASLASCMVIANVAQCQVIVVFHDVSEGTDEPAATVINPGSADAPAEVADETALSEPNSTDSTAATAPAAPAASAQAELTEAGDEILADGSGVTSDEPVIVSEAPVPFDIDAEIAGDTPIAQPYDLPAHSRVCPYSGDWLDYGVREYHEPSLQSAEIQAVEEDAITEPAIEGSVSGEIETFDRFDRADNRDAALRVAATLDRIGSWLHEVSGEIRDWVNEGDDSADESTDEVEVGITESSDESSQYDESVDMIEQLE